MTACKFLRFAFRMTRFLNLASFVDMKPPLQLGIVGAGAIAQRGLLPHFSQDDVQNRVQLAAICDPVPGRAEAAATQWNVPRAFLSLEELLEQGEVDVVSLCSPIGLHFEQGRAALNAGKHVHFNKTMTTTVAQADELIELAQTRGLKIVASPGEVLRPQYKAMRELLQSGAIGTLCWGICGASSGQYHTQDEAEFRAGDTVLSNVDPSWYYRKPGGGPLYDMVVYPLHVLTSVLGAAKRVTALSGLRLKEREFGGKMVAGEADDQTLMLLDFGEGVFVSVYGMAVGGVNQGWAPRLFGTKGEIAGLNLNGQPIDYPNKTGDDLRSQQAALPHVVGPHRDIDEAHVFEDVMQLVDWIRDDKPTPVTAQHARHVVDIIESAYRAAETGQTQTLSTSF